MNIFIQGCPRRYIKSALHTIGSPERHVKLINSLLLQLRGNYSTTKTQVNDNHKIKDEKYFKDSQGYHKFYRFPHITTVRLVSRMKLYQTGFTLAIVPYTMLAFNQGNISIVGAGLTVGISVFACFMLYVMSAYTMRLVGLMALSDDNTTVRISHLTFWGKREDAYLSVNDIVPLSDSNQSPSDAYVEIMRYDGKEKFLLSVKYGQILDKERFTTVFGLL